MSFKMRVIMFTRGTAVFEFAQVWELYRPGRRLFPLLRGKLVDA